MLLISLLFFPIFFVFFIFVIAVALAGNSRGLGAVAVPADLAQRVVPLSLVTCERGWGCVWVWGWVWCRAGGA
jgi:hypothetical protein